MFLKARNGRSAIICLTLFMTIVVSLGFSATAKAMPFYGLNPKYFCVRASFFTEYEKSSNERKSNIKLAANSINGTLVDAGGEFSFNAVVGPRTEKRGYKTSKIIMGGEFVDGVGGGVCQVSTTLYNAVLLAGLKITEYHAHSLPVSYVSPSFDAMVNSGSADLRFVNDTSNPVVIKTVADDKRLTVSIIGEPKKYKYVFESVITEKISAPDYLIKKDINGDFPDLYEGERLYLSYSKDGLKSQAYVELYRDGKRISRVMVRSDVYCPVQGKVVEGTKKRPVSEDLS